MAGSTRSQTTVMASGPAPKPRCAGAAITETWGRFGGETNFIGPLEAGVDSNPAYVMHYGAHFTKDMDNNDIKDIILELARRALRAIVVKEMEAVPNSVIMFEAAYVSWGPEDGPGPELWDIAEAVTLAGRVLKLGWDGLCALPSIWGVKTAWYVINNAKYALSCRAELLHRLTVSHFIVNGGGRPRLMWVGRTPDFGKNIEDFEKVYPDFRIRPAADVRPAGWLLPRTRGGSAVSSQLVVLE